MSSPRAGCPKGHPIPQSDLAARFCRVCGEPLERLCPKGHRSPASAKFCTSCGISLEPTSPAEPPTRVDASPAAPPPAPAPGLAVPGAMSAPVTAKSPTRATPRSDDLTPPAGAQLRPGAPDPSSTMPVQPIAYAGRPAARPGSRKGLTAAIIGAVVLLGLAGALAVVLVSKGSPAKSVSSVTSTTLARNGLRTNKSSTTTSTPPTTSAQPTEEVAAKALAVLLAQSVTDRSAIDSASDDVSACGPTLDRDASTFQTASASRQTLLSELSTLQDASALPPQLIETLSQAWETSEEVDNDYANWANEESENGCVPDDTSNSYFQAAETPNNKATQYKQGFANLWNSIATQYGLATYQWNQL